MKNGYVYIFLNSSMPGQVKIGETKDPVDERAKELHTTGVPTPFTCYYAEWVPDCKKVESQMHEFFANYRTNGNREFFKLKPEIAKQALQALVGGKDMLEFIKRLFGRGKTNETIEPAHAVAQEEPAEVVFIPRAPIDNSYTDLPDPESEDEEPVRQNPESSESPKQKDLGLRDAWYKAGNLCEPMDDRYSKRGDEDGYNGSPETRDIGLEWVRSTIRANLKTFRDRRVAERNQWLDKALEYGGASPTLIKRVELTIESIDTEIEDLTQRINNPDDEDIIRACNEYQRSFDAAILKREKFNRIVGY